MDWQLVRSRTVPAGADLAIGAPAVTVALVAALLVVAVPLVWQVLRLAVTLVHELGHALVGMAVGRRFTGFVLRGDMSGHAVTVGPTRGLGRVLRGFHAGMPPVLPQLRPFRVVKNVPLAEGVFGLTLVPDDGLPRYDEPRP